MQIHGNYGLKLLRRFSTTSVLSQGTTLLLAGLLVGSMAMPVMAQDTLLSQNDSEAVPDEPTPIEQIAPQGLDSQSGVPGAEPLYDKAVTITQIEIQGNALIPDETILNAIETRPGSLYNKDRLTQDLQSIYDLGYFSENIRAVPIATREGVHIRYEVQENPVVKGFEFKNNQRLTTSQLEDVFDGQVNLPQNINAVNAGIKRIEKMYQDQGYVLARVDGIDETADGQIVLTVNEGIINNIAFTGNKKTKDYVIKRSLAQKVDEPYNEKVVAGDMKRLFSAQSYSDVRRVVKASDTKPGTYDLVIEVDEKKTGAISLGGGIDTGTGVFGSVGFNDPNFRGRGQNFSTVASVGSGVLTDTNQTLVRRRVLQFQGSWFNPSIRESNTSLGANVFARELGSFNVPLGIERRYGGEMTLGRPIESLPGVSVGLTAGAEQVKIREGADAPQLAAFGLTPGSAERQRELEDASYLSLTPSMAYDTRNNRFSPTSGWYNTFGNRFALGIGGEGDSYSAATVNLRRYLYVTDEVTLALNAQGGGTWLGDVPDFNAYRMGGSYTVRGFQEGSLGIGQHYVMGTAELRARIPFLKRFHKMPFYDMVQLALFTDAGKLFDESPSNDIFDRPGYGIAVGAGLRLNVPALGPLRIDYAVPLGGNKGLGIQNVNFGVNQKF